MKRLTTIVTCLQQIRVVLTMNMLVASSAWGTDALSVSQTTRKNLGYPTNIRIWKRLLLKMRIPACSRSDSTKADALQKHGMCQFCFSDPAKPVKDQLRQWTDNLSVHLWKCEDAHSPGFWRRPFCGQMIQCSDRDPTCHCLLPRWKPSRLISWHTIKIATRKH